ncbi:MAG: restriction endonuclease [Terracidiphilus sp.]|nr:restriction endonuclease [Terracidiphilus sp.]
MQIPDFQTIMLPLLKLSASKEWRISDAVEQLANDFHLSQEDRALLIPSGRQTTFSNRVAWAKSYLAKAGLVIPTKRAHFCISEQGKKVLETPPERITIKYLSQFPEFQEFRKDGGADKHSNGAETTEQDSSLTPDEAIRKAHAQLEQELADELLIKIRTGSPAFFENLVVRLLIAMEYGGSVEDINRALVGGTGDGGIDGVIDQDILGLDRIYVQAKRYAEGNTVGASAIRDFFGSLDRFKATKGLFVTASTFTVSARETAGMLSKRIVLIDGSQLTRLMIRHNVGCRIDQTIDIKEIDEEFFE